jgi:DNA polymerase-3 subunit epsilon
MVANTRGGARWCPRHAAWGGALLCLAIFAATDLLLVAGIADAAARARTHLVLGGAAALCCTALAALALALRKLVFQPLELLGKEIRIVAGVNPGYEIALPGPHLLGEVPAAVQALAAAVASCTLATAAAVAERSRDLESRRERLEAILLSLEEGILVCDERARVVFYNPAARRAFHDNPALGIGRSLRLLCAPAPVEAALQILRRRRLREPGEGDREGDVSFVCTAVNGIVLSCRLRLLPELPGLSWSFLFVCEDISGEAAERGRSEELLRAAVKAMRAPLTGLGLSAESLEMLPDLDAAGRAALERTIAEDTRRVVAQFEIVAREVDGLASPRYVIRDVSVEDIVASVAQRLAEKGLRLTMIGDPLWVRADVQALLFLLEFFALGIRRCCGVEALEVETLLGDRQVYCNFCWQGRVVTQAEIQGWMCSLAEPLGAHTVAEVLERLGSEVWSQPHETPGFATLRFPLPSPAGQWAAPQPALPSRPVYVDVSGPLVEVPAAEWGRLALEHAHFVVFDTETTGLAPLAGDEIVSLAGVKIVERGIVLGETFDRIVDPGRPIPESSTRFHGITDETVRGRPRIEQALREFHAFVGDAVLVGHNGAFDLRFIRLKEQGAGVHFKGPVLDTLALSRFLHDHTPAHSLDAVARRVGVEIRDRHTALGDALITAQVLLKFLYLLQERGVTTLGGAFEACR